MLNSNEKNLKLTASSAQTAILGAYSAMVLQALNIYIWKEMYLDLGHLHAICIHLLLAN